jgi:VanZ family protein
MSEPVPVRGGSATAANPPLFGRGRCAGWALGYAVAVLYVSTVLGPGGFNFVPRDPAAAWSALVATPYLANGSDQRPDWMANLAMLVPLGFLAAGALWPGVGVLRRVSAAGAALLGCIIFVVAVKYAQLFFPPRTVSLNYIVAQSLGAFAGVALFWLLRDRIAAVRADVAGGNRSLAALCALYTLAYLVFLLFPFDFALSGEDLRQRAAALPQLLLSFPGARLPPGLRLLLPLVDAAATIPIGVLLAVTRRSWPLGRIALAGLLIMSMITAATLPLLDATPSLAALAIRTAGIVAGAVLARRLARGAPGVLRHRLAALAPWFALPYAIAVLYVKGLLSSGWRTMPEALAAFDPLGLLPFYHDYIVTKAHAAQSVAFELICFAPIGVMIGLRGRCSGRASVWLAALIALVFSVAVEFGRWLKPGLQPDFSNPVIAALGAALAVGLTTILMRSATIPAAPDRVAARPPLVTGHGDRVRTPTLPRTGRDGGRTPPLVAALRLAVALVCLTTAGIVAAQYPLMPWLLAAGLMLYAAALWRWPSLWLAVLPMVLPAFDLAPWTGWIEIGEPDLFVLVTVAILVLRQPPGAADFRFRGLAAAALVLTVLSCIAGVALGLTAPGPPSGSDNPYLHPDNALRVAKGLVTALVLLPFLRERLRRRPDALTWLGVGMIAGLTLVAAAAIMERALFPGVLDVSADYRVAATFSAMHVGGGYIDAYIAMTLPFLLVCMIRPRLTRLVAMMVFAAAAGYALVVTFSRTAYAAASISIAVACLGWRSASRHGNTSIRGSVVLPLVLLAVVAGAVGIGILMPVMTDRMGRATPDLAGREASWIQGLALREPGLFATLFGTGFGTYPRTVLARKPDGRFPTNFVLGRDGGYRFLSLSAGTPLYFGQKVTVEPDRIYRLFLGLRSSSGGSAALTVILCEKWLLYSDSCRSTILTPATIGKWEDFGVPISTAGLGRSSLFGWLRRPVELSLVDQVSGTTIDIGDVRLLDAVGHDVLTNGDFSRGTERWFFTDDDHLAWRIENQYVMIFVESGVLGLAALLALTAAALLGAARGIRHGEPMAACVAGAVTGFLVCAGFDGLLDAPRLATLFYLIAFCGLAMLPQSPGRDPSLGSA